MNISASKQTTLSNKVSCFGVGLHSGKQVNLAIYPAMAGTGIVFKRLDVPAEHAIVPARYDLVTDTRLGTTIRNAFGTSVSTIEHLMAAFWGAGVDNALVELDGAEVPIMDGSSEPFIFMLECARVVSLSAPRRSLRMLRTVEVRDGDSVARIAPNTEGEEGCTLSIEIKFDHALIDQQTSHYDFRETTFKKSLSRARTFGFEDEVAALQGAGLALGGSLENAVVVGKDRILNEEGLRYDDEFVRHKALDCLGDVFLSGVRMDAHLSFFKPGHAINNKLLRAIFADDTAYVIEEEGALPNIAHYAASFAAARA